MQIVRHEKESPLSSNLCPILNTLDHLMLVLANWAETPFFLKLALDLSQAKKSTNNGENTVNHEEEKEDERRMEEYVTVPEFDRFVILLIRILLYFLGSW